MKQLILILTFLFCLVSFAFAGGEQDSTSETAITRNVSV